MNTSPAFDPADPRPSAAWGNYEPPVLRLLDQARAQLAARDQLRDRLRREYPDAGVIKTPWGWAGRDPHGNELQATTLEALEPLLKKAWRPG